MAYLPGLELNKVGFWVIWLSSYLATLGSVSSALRMGKVLLKNSSVLALKSSLKRKYSFGLGFTSRAAGGTYNGYETPSTFCPMGLRGK